MARHIVFVDIPAIKGFVFGTDRLREICGASGLLAAINRRFGQVLKDAVGENGSVQEVYANGGSGQFIVEADPPALDRAMLALGKFVADETRLGARLVHASAPWPEGATYQDCLAEAFRQLRRAKDRPGLAALASTPFAMDCQSCSDRPAARLVRLPEGEKEWICEACQAKRDHPDSLWKELEEHLHFEFGPATWQPPHDLGEIGTRSRPRGWLGVVYADGNAMGSLIRKIGLREDFSLFARTVDEAVRGSCHVALARVIGHRDPSKADFPARILLLGGDDLVVALPAQHALDFVVAVEEEFERHTAKGLADSAFFRHELAGRGLTLSFGVTLCKASFPFRTALDLCEELLKSAKAAGRSGTGGHAESYTDFHVIGESQLLNLAELRERDYTLPAPHGGRSAGPRTHRLTLRPYRTADLARLSQAVGILRAVPRGKVHQLYEALHQGDFAARLEAVRLLSRRGGRELRQALDIFGCAGDRIPWRPSSEGPPGAAQDDLPGQPPWESPVTELAELLDFLAGDAKGQQSRLEAVHGHA